MTQHLNLRQLSPWLLFYLFAAQRGTGGTQTQRPFTGCFSETGQKTERPPTSQQQSELKQQNK
ncbi:hypothetical protein ACFSC6_11565 [Rufibacter sediminis]|uniref:Secreted protein n=1 Tax=Rufibacter sediminis TaxID=2762756 RepID=A0ABR6VUG7_9BACT|nr:hypothetical protein [Rufibacter sediminis]MBC3540517.1 hypothetical protein [Rufibacter sediminis]